jgi:Chlamydia polymorphic membrane protein (Chlamydia_PMP) repeat
MMRNIGFLSFLAIGLCVTAAPAGTTIYVDDDAPVAGDGLAWSTAYRFLQDALSDARNSVGVIDEIRVAAGTYLPDRSEAWPNGTGFRSYTFEVVSGTSIRGGYAGLLGANPDLRDLSANPTILSGDLAADDLPAASSSWSENSLHVLTVRQLMGRTELDGLVITAGYADGSGQQGDGAGMLNSESGDIVVMDSVFKSNRAMRNGGAVRNVANQASFIRCTFEGNSAASDGGAVFDDRSTGGYFGCVFASNSARNGGAVARRDRPTVLESCSFVSNTALEVGGAVFNDESGGTTFINCSFRENSSSGGGAIFNSAASFPTFLNSVFVGNVASISGGAICNFGNGAEPLFRNSILWDNTPDEVIDDFSAMTTIEVSVIQGGWSGAGSGISTDDPLFVDAASGDLRLAPDSPCINQGDNAFVVGIETDLGGGPRIIGGTVDLGAFEACTLNVQCDDGDAATSDSCVAGACVNEIPPSVCLGPSDCDDDGDPCTTATCIDGVCQIANNTDPCDDGNACTTSDTCSSGVCAGVAIDCDDNNSCTTDSCSSGACQNVPNTSTCDDGNACTANDICSAGSCTGTPLDCDDGIACTSDSCSQGLCVNDASTCECTTNPDCNDGSPCTFDMCNSGTCAHINVTGSCDDGDACTTNDTCSSGSCTGISLDCDDGVACTVDSCNFGVCVNDATACGCSASDCDDGIACTVDSCVGGTCRNDSTACDCAIDKDCFDANRCTVDLCGSDRMCYNETLAECCGNGICEKGEDSCNCSADCADSPSAICGNNVCEAGDGEDCVTCPDDCNGLQDGLIQNRFCCGGGGGYNAISCNDRRCYDRSVSCTDDSVSESCCGDGICDSYESGCFCPEDCGPPIPFETAGVTCKDGIDNDCDGLLDCDDPDCKKEPLCWTCDEDGICDPGENCRSCPSDCDGMARGRRLRRFCCGNGILEAGERDPAVCDGNP